MHKIDLQVLINYRDTQEMPPVVFTSKYYLVSVYRDGNFLLATSKGETQPLLAIEFLHRVCDIFEEYFDCIDNLKLVFYDNTMIHPPGVSEIDVYNSK